MSSESPPLLAGRYSLGLVLGRGEGTRIHRAQDSATGRPVAIKIAETEAAAEGLRREFEVLLALRHPHLPEVHQLGLDQVTSCTFLARELVEGRSLDVYSSEEATGSLVAVLRQVARTLAFLHGRGVVHGDVKPANVLVRTLPEGEAWSTLIDLGFAVGRADTPGRVFRGSPYYSPVRLLGGAPRGAVDDVFALARTFLDLRPEEDWGAALEALLVRSTSEDPDLRPQDARAFLNALDQAAPLPADIVGDSDPVGFVDRIKELDLLERCIDDEDIGVTTVTGPPGIGKSALMRAFRARLRGANRLVVHLECRDAAQDPGESLVRRLSFCPGVRSADRVAIFHSIGRDARGNRVPGGGAIRTPAAADLSAALGRFLVVLGRKGGVVVLLDELDLEHLDRNGPIARVLLRLSRGRGIPGVTFILAGTGHLENVEAGKRVRRLALDEMPLPAATELARFVLKARRWKESVRGEHLDELCRRIVQVAGGHPGFVEAVARGLSSGSSSGDVGLDSGLTANVPASFSEAVGVRLDTLRPDARRILEVLSMFQTPADATVLVDLVDIPDARRRAGMDELRRGGLVGYADLTAEDAGELDRHHLQRGGYFVTSRVVASSVRERVDPERMARLHARAVALLSARAFDDAEAKDEVALHALASMRAGLVAEHVPPCVRGLLERGLPSRATSIARRALAVLESTSKGAPSIRISRATTDLRLSYADALLAGGEFRQALASYELAATDVQEPENIVHVMRQQAECQVTMGDFEGAERRLAAIEPTVLDAITPEERALLAGTRARLAFKRGRPTAATRLLHRGLEELGEQMQSTVAAELWNNLGVVAFETARFEESEQWHRRALDVRKIIGDVRGVSFSLGNLANIAFVRGELAEARDGYRKALELKRKLGEPAAIATSLSNLGLVAQGMGDFAEALSRHEEALYLREEIGDEVGRARSLERLAELMRLKGCHGRAIQLAERSVRVATSTGERDVGLAAALLTLAEIAIETGHFERAEKAIDEGIELCMEVGLPSEAALLNARGAEVKLLTRPGDAAGLRRLERAIESLRKGGDSAALARALQVQAEVALDEGKDLRAGQAAQEIMRLGERSQNPTVIAAGRFVTGVIKDREGASTAASDLLHQVREDAERLGLPRLLWSAQAALADFHERRGRHERSARWSLRCIETIRGELKELENENEEIAFLAHPRRARALGLLARRARGRFHETGSRIG